MFSCEQHDYLEIACMFKYLVDIQLKDTQHVYGRAITTRVRAGREYLVVDNQGESLEVEMTHMHSLKVLTQGARFTELVISA